VPGFVHHLVTEDGLPTQGDWYGWQPGLVLMHAISDGLIALAYVSFPVVLVHFVRKRHRVPFHWTFLAFGVFTIACGATHIMEVVDLWHPCYWLAGTIKAIAAVASLVAAALMIRLVPRALALPILHDALTGLCNRALFEDRIDHAVLVAARTKACFGILFLDLGHFKQINDTYGHGIGDEVLRAVGERIQRSLRAADTCARWGGDEFAVLLPDAGLDASRTAADRICEALARPYVLNDGTELTLAAAVGIAIFPIHGGNRQTLLEFADGAMYGAKRSGKHRISTRPPSALSTDVSGSIDPPARQSGRVASGKFRQESSAPPVKRRAP
jgi:diguanylate cyclase (GGDEF)-like protein